jgi:hypothetical protein
METTSFQISTSVAILVALSFIINIFPVIVIFSLSDSSLTFSDSWLLCSSYHCCWWQRRKQTVRSALFAENDHQPQQASLEQCTHQATSHRLPIWPNPAITRPTLRVVREVCRGWLLGGPLLTTNGADAMVKGSFLAVCLNFGWHNVSGSTASCRALAKFCWYFILKTIHNEYIVC